MKFGTEIHDPPRMHPSDYEHVEFAALVHGEIPLKCITQLKLLVTCLNVIKIHVLVW